MDATPRPPLLKRMPRGARTTLTWCAAIAFAVVTFVTLPGHTLRSFLGGQGWLFVAMAVVTALLLSRVRRRPLPVLGLLLAGSVAATTMLNREQIPLLQFLAVTVTVCFVAAARPRQVSIAAAVTAGGVLAGCLLLVVGHLDTPSAAAGALMIVIAWLIGNSIRQRRDYAGALRAQATAQAVTDERLRIARELHDMVAHSVAIIAIQAGMGSRVMATQPSEAHNALTAIEATSRETLAGLRRMLVALRQAEPGPAAGPAPLDPAPGLADIDRLAATTMDAGVRVHVQWHGQRRPLPADIDLSAFRIIQEAVTNVVRHAGTEHCRVSIDHRDAELSIEVVDDGRGCVTADAGYGLIGMRERVGLLHGQFTAGPRAEGGFRVAAQLPVPAGAR